MPVLLHGLTLHDRKATKSEYFLKQDKCPTITIDGNCPSCKSTEWKLTKLLVLNGTINVDTESSGGGFGISAGLGRGQGGVGINYQGIDLDTRGTHTTGIALKYAEPEMHPDFPRKDQLLQDCSDSIQLSIRGIEKVDIFAEDETALKPGIFSRVHFDGLESDYKKARETLLSLQTYEIEKGIWDHTRVCLRCDESFITEHDRQIAVVSYPIPEYTFEGQDRRCPKCRSYYWKPLRLFYVIRIQGQTSTVIAAEKNLAEALAYSANPNEGGFWKKLGNKLFTDTVESATTKLERSKLVLSELQTLSEQEATKCLELSKTRICLDCETIYTLTTLVRPEAG